MIITGILLHFHCKKSKKSYPKKDNEPRKPIFTKPFRIAVRESGNAGIEKGVVQPESVDKRKLEKAEVVNKPSVDSVTETSPSPGCDRAKSNASSAAKVRPTLSVFRTSPYNCKRPDSPVPKGDRKRVIDNSKLFFVDSTLPSKLVDGNYLFPGSLALISLNSHNPQRLTTPFQGVFRSVSRAKAYQLKISYDWDYGDDVIRIRFERNASSWFACMLQVLYYTPPLIHILLGSHFPRSDRKARIKYPKSMEQLFLYYFDYITGRPKSQECFQFCNNRILKDTMDIQSFFKKTLEDIRLSSLPVFENDILINKRCSRFTYIHQIFYMSVTNYIKCHRCNYEAQSHGRLKCLRVKFRREGLDHSICRALRRKSSKKLCNICRTQSGEMNEITREKKFVVTKFPEVLIIHLLIDPTQRDYKTLGYPLYKFLTFVSNTKNGRIIMKYTLYGIITGVETSTGLVTRAYLRRPSSQLFVPNDYEKQPVSISEISFPEIYFLFYINKDSYE